MVVSPNSKVVKFSKVGEICMGDSGGWQSLTPNKTLAINNLIFKVPMKRKLINAETSKLWNFCRTKREVSFVGSSRLGRVETSHNPSE